MSKKKCVLYGNCQIIIGIKSYLESQKDISLEIITMQSFTMIRKQIKIDYDLIKSCEIFIYQPVNDSYGEYSSNNFLQHLNSNCIKIGVPFLYMDSFFPLLPINIAHDIDGGKKIDENNILNKEVIINLKKNHNNEDIIDLYDNYCIDFNFKKRFDDNINRIFDKEKICDIKIVDFILENYKDIKLFDMHHHPTKILFDKIAEQIFEKLKICSGINENKWNGILSVENYPYSIYSINYFKFNWIKREDHNAHEYYKELIKNII